jgi:hypothetical protein
MSENGTQAVMFTAAFVSQVLATTGHATTANPERASQLYDRMEQIDAWHLRWVSATI